jgi:hypothetical protein
MKSTSRIRSINENIEALYQSLRRAVQEEFPLGSSVSFDHNGYLQTGTVVNHYGWNLYVRNNKTGKDREVAYQSIIGVGYEIDPEDERKTVYRPKDV